MTEKTITYADDGIRLDRWFKRHLPHITHALLQKELRKGQVRLDGKKADASDRVAQGQALQFPDAWKNAPEEEAPRKKQPQPVSENTLKDIESCILFEDARMVVLNKPFGLAVQGGTGQKESVDAIMTARAALRKEAPPKLVHRLDKDTSGVLVMGKTAKDAATLAGVFARKQAEKYYWALVLGVPDIEAGTIDMPLSKKAVGKDSRIEKMQEDEEDGKNAITNYFIVERAARHLSWVELQPVTGRTHQLRVHMAAIGHPILGDGKYGGSDAFLDGEMPKKLHLHARKLVLPLGGKTVTFEAPLSGHMKQSWKLFEFREPKVKRK